MIRGAKTSGNTHIGLFSFLKTHDHATGEEEAPKLQKKTQTTNKVAQAI